jgi:hypothetical protein
VFSYSSGDVCKTWASQRVPACQTGKACLNVVIISCFVIMWEYVIVCGDGILRRQDCLAVMNFRRKFYTEDNWRCNKVMGLDMKIDYI